MRSGASARMRNREYHIPAPVALAVSGYHIFYFVFFKSILNIVTKSAPETHAETANTHRIRDRRAGPTERQGLCPGAPPGPRADARRLCARGVRYTARRPQFSYLTFVWRWLGNNEHNSLTDVQIVLMKPPGFTEVPRSSPDGPERRDAPSRRARRPAPGRRVSHPALGDPSDQLSSYWGDCLATCTGRSMRRASMKAVFFS